MNGEHLLMDALMLLGAGSFAHDAYEKRSAGNAIMAVLILIVFCLPWPTP